MIKLGRVREDLEKFDYCEVIYNLSTSGCERNREDYEYIYQLLMKDDSYEIPYSCYEVVYDWDDYGYGDGADVVCFYSDNIGFLAKNEKARDAYGKLEKE